MLKQAFAAREAYEALRDLKQILDEVTDTTHAVELESFHVAAAGTETDSVRRALQEIVNRLSSPGFDDALSQVRQKLETAASL